MSRSTGGLALRLGAGIAVVAGATLAFTTLVSANPTTVAFSYLILVLLAATEWGLVEATVLAIVASLAFNLYFLPPVGRLTIADPENWVSFIAFVLTAVVVSQLSGRARARHLDAVTRQRDLERLYTLSRGLLLAEAGVDTAATIARQIAEAFDLDGLALYDHHSGAVARAGRLDLPDVDPRLREVVSQATTLREADGLIVIAIRLGGAPIGSLALQGPPISDTVLQSVANLVAIGLERAREREAAAGVDAAQRSSALRAAILDAVAHEFKTPLTSIRAAVGGLATAQPGDARELATIIDEESQRLQGLVSDAITMLRVEAGDVQVERTPLDLRALVDRTIRDLGARATARIENDVAADVTVDADGALLGLALRLVLDNGLKYGTSDTLIHVNASIGSAIDLTVRNIGPAIPPHERERIFERFYRGSVGVRQPGSGMGLTIVRQIVRAHGGDVSVGGEGTTTDVHLVLPRGEGR